MKKRILVTLLLASLLFSLAFAGAVPVKAVFVPSETAYYDRVKNVLGLTQAQENMLSKYGFVTVEVPNMTKFEDFYGELVYKNDLPVIVTTDSVLHMFHVVFDCSLRILENNTFYPILLELTQYAYNASSSEYAATANDGSQKYWAISNSTVYFAVALSLLTNTTINVPPELSDEVAFYLNNINAEDLQFVLAAIWHMPVSPYDVEVKYDFTQFKVRGHYLGDPQLENYFRTMMWYGQFPIFIPRYNETYSESYEWLTPHIDDTALVFIRDIMKENQQEYQNWQLLYNVTDALIGKSDSINLLSLETALHNVFGDREKYLDLATQGNGPQALRQELSKPEYEQKILSQALVSGTPGAILPDYPLVFQFMGQRFVPDSYMFQNLCWDKVGYNSTGDRRTLPKGLDVFAVLGSQRAYQLLTPDFNYSSFEDNLNSLKQEFDGLTEENWTYSSYTSWVYALQSLVNSNNTSNYPDFMKNVPWQDEKLNTALGSWAQLRHDTILYAKQTYIPAFLCSYPEAFVEPNPTFYSRMKALAEQTLNAVNMLGPNVNSVVLDSLQTLANYSDTFETISEKELAKEALTPDETSFLQHLAQIICGGLTGWYPDLLDRIANQADYQTILDASVICDVATFPPGDIQYPPQILHVGTGYVYALVTLFPLPNGTLVAAVGPVFSYYEFPLIGTKRLNDNDWKNMLNTGNRTMYLPSWSKDIYALADPVTPEYTSLTLLAAPAVITIVLTATKTIANRKRHTTSHVKPNSSET
jgi:hypothetical protein